VAETFAAYMPYIRKRWLQEREGWAHRRELAWASARQAAEVLRRRFGAETVFAFGSLVRGGTFDERSDVDLAVRGVPPQDFFRASAAAAAAVCEFDLDLIDLDDCSPALREQVQREGVGL
jgi:predicted nucleotidyltransferase